MYIDGTHLHTTGRAYCLQYQNRRRMIQSELRPQLHAYLGGILRNLGAKPLKINGTDDHVHVLTDTPAALSVADAVCKLKSNSTGWVRDRWPKLDFAWQQGYFAHSVSPTDMSKLIEYIERQEEHHRRISFRDELIQFLRKLGIPYDERFLL